MADGIIAFDGGRSGAVSRSISPKPRLRDFLQALAISAQAEVGAEADQRQSDSRLTED